MNKETKKDAAYLSVVVTSRNDDHGGKLLLRMQIFIDTFLQQCKRHRLPAELVIVEWNPPFDKPRLRHALDWPVDLGPCAVRIIEVPNELHMRLPYSDCIPLFQLPAKNVGVRRASGRFVLATSADILFSDELFAFLASSSLRRNKMYRVDRYDVPDEVPLQATPEERLRFCWQNILRIHSRDMSRDLITGEENLIYPSQNLRQRAKEEVARWRKSSLRIHTNTSGDFILMAREHWLALRGFPELAMRSTHVDSLLLYMAFFGPTSEKYLSRPKVIFHIEHKRNEGDCIHTNEASTKPPVLSIPQFYEWAAQMCRERKPMIFNDEKWGLATEDLPEKFIRV